MYMSLKSMLNMFGGTSKLHKSSIFLTWNWLIQVKEDGWMGFSEGWQGCSEEQPCLPEGNSVHPDSFSWIKIPFKIGHFGDNSVFSSSLKY